MASLFIRVSTISSSSAVCGALQKNASAVGVAIYVS
jgi:hypothetical protein